MVQNNSVEGLPYEMIFIATSYWKKTYFTVIVEKGTLLVDRLHF